MKNANGAKQIIRNKLNRGALLNQSVCVKPGATPNPKSPQKAKRHVGDPQKAKNIRLLRIINISRAFFS